MFGWEAGDLVGHHVREVLLDEGQDVLARLAVDVDADASTVVGLELEGRRSDGSAFPLEVSARPLRTGTKSDEVLVVCTLHDVTMRIRSVDDARRRLVALVDSANLGIISTAPDGRIASWNGGAEAVLGHTAQEMIGRPLARLMSSSPGGNQGDLTAHLQSGGAVAPFDIVLPHRQGRDVQLSMTVSPIVDPIRGQLGHSLVFQDITLRKGIEAALALAKEEAENTSKEFEAFSYAVAHDLRAPLRAIDGFSQALLEDDPTALDHNGKAYLAQMRASATYMAQLIDSLLALARLTNGGVQSEAVDLSELARATIDRCRTADPERAVEVIIQDDVFGRGDRTMLALALDNLLGNAWKYTRTRDPARIEFGCSTDAGVTTYFVRDNGIGFDMAYSDKLFGVFQRLHAVEAFEGTGIGLATAKKVLQRHGGHIWAHGEVDRGATFSFILKGHRHGLVEPRPPSA